MTSGEIIMKRVGVSSFFLTKISEVKGKIKEIGMKFDLNFFDESTLIDPINPYVRK